MINSLFSLLVLGVLTYTALAHSAGMTGQTQAGCTCHSSTPNTNTKVTLSSGSGSYIFEPSSKTTFTVTVENSSKSKAGMNVGVKTSETSGNNVGTLSAGNGTKIQSGEVTHNGAQTLSGGKFSFTFDWTAPSTHGEYWIRGVSNAVNGNGNNTGDEWNRFTTQKIVVAGVTVTAPDGGENWCVDSKQDIKWKSDGIDNVKIEYSTNGGSSWNVLTASIPASTGSYTWTIPSDFTPGTTNQIRISDASKSTRNDVSNSNFTINGESIITAQPVNDTTCTGQSFTFSVTVSGSGLKYQWRKNGNNISGATSSSYGRSNTLKDDKGNYDCVITTACGDVLTSELASLTVFVTPSFTTQPKGKSACEGENITLTAVVEGDFASMQWYKDGNAISGANQQNYIIASLDEASAGSYKLKVTSANCGTEVSSSAAVIKLNIDPIFTQQPVSTEACVGGEVNFTAKTDGTISGFQWYKDGVKLNGATSRDLKIEEVAVEDAGEYKLQLTGSCGVNPFSDVVTLTVNSLPLITLQPAGKEVFVGDAITLFVVADNPGGAVNELIYQWKKDGINIAGATDSILTIENASLEDAGKYRVVVKNTCPLSDIISNEAEVKVLEKTSGPAVTLNITSLDFSDVNLGETISKTFTEVITNSGDEPLTITSMAVLGDEATAFQLTSPTLPITIEPNMKLDIGLDFTPNKVGLHNAKISFESNSINSVEIPISGNGVENGTLTSSVSTLDFGEVAKLEAATGNFELSNPTTKDITITEVLASTNEFTVGSGVVGTTIKPSEKLEVEVTFIPTKIGDYAEELTINSDDGKSLEITLKAKVTETSVWEGIPSISSAVAYPNPSENSVAISLAFDNVEEYSINIVDLKGKVIKTINGFSTIGTNIIEWNNTDISNNRVSAGIYYAIIQVGNNIQTIPIVVM